MQPILAAMVRKPQQPPQQTKWHVYRKIAARREWVGEIKAVDEHEAIKIAAKEFKQPATKLSREGCIITWMIEWSPSRHTPVAFKAAIRACVSA